MGVNDCRENRRNRIIIINITIKLSTLMETSDPIEEYCFRLTLFPQIVSGVV